jgi:hypothetical protein
VPRTSNPAKVRLAEFAVRTNPTDHHYPLYAAVTQALPWLHDGKAFLPWIEIGV